jgi:hypothetical protein
MDRTLGELVSRYIDGDLDDAESSRLEARAETDPELAEEIDATRQIRQAVQKVASRMEPPAALDPVMEPLRQGPPASAQRVRPVYRWLGVAAAVVLGVTVAMEMGRRNPAPTLSRPLHQRDRSVREPDKIFELAPLPTAMPDDSRPLGAADHLLEEEPTLPEAPEPAPLDVVGPLTTAAPFNAPVEPIPSTQQRLSAREEGLEIESVESAQERPAKKLSRTPADGVDQIGSGAPTTRDQLPTESARKPPPWRVGVGKSRPAPAATGGGESRLVSVVLQIDDHPVWSGSSSACRAGTWPVRIEVRGGVVSAMEPDAAAAKDKTAAPCTPEALIGSSLEGVGDGFYFGEFVVAESPE